MQAALTPKRTRGATVHARLTLRMGDEKSLFGQEPVGELTAAMLPRGAGGMTRTQLQDAFDKLKADVRFTGNETRTTVSIQTTRENFPEVMKLVAMALRRPDFPAAELEQLKNERATEIEAQRKEPDDLARNVMARTGNPYPKGDVRHEYTLDEQIGNVKAVAL